VVCNFHPDKDYTTALRSSTMESHLMDLFQRKIVSKVDKKNNNSLNQFNDALNILSRFSQKISQFRIIKTNNFKEKNFIIILLNQRKSESFQKLL
jgi:hypothetical protein